MANQIPSKHHTRDFEALHATRTMVRTPVRSSLLSPSTEVKGTHRRGRRSSSLSTPEAQLQKVNLHLPFNSQHNVKSKIPFSRRKAALSMCFSVIKLPYLQRAMQKLCEDDMKGDPLWDAQVLQIPVFHTENVRRGHPAATQFHLEIALGPELHLVDPLSKATARNLEARRGRDADDRQGRFVSVVLPTGCYRVELGNGGHYSAKELQARVDEIRSKILAGVGITLNAPHVTQRGQFGFQFPFWQSFSAKVPIAGISSTEMATRIIGALQATRIWRVVF
ncbi:3-oxoacyl-[acyl-carrier-protein] synthase [Tulasnella sp. 427]|nr:3-oxoacyl-[acyl-carrier-protein] synthase [Tulasnella sp. 427]